MSDQRIRTGTLRLVGEPAPLFLLADSQLLFGAAGGTRVVERIAAATPPAPSAVFLGASGGDEPAFYELFRAAMEPLGSGDRGRVTAAPSPAQLALLERADVVVLGGGEVDRGWRAFERSGVRERVERRRAGGAVLVGVSAGAVQLGTAGWPEGRPEAWFDTWGFAPFVVDAHAEQGGWTALRRVVAARGAEGRGIGVPTGGGAVLHPDGTLEALRHPLLEVGMGPGGAASALILPPAPATPPDAA